jgi:hypothetical protein
MYKAQYEFKTIPQSAATSVFEIQQVMVFYTMQDSGKVYLCNLFSWLDKEFSKLLGLSKQINKQVLCKW